MLKIVTKNIPNVLSSIRIIAAPILPGLFFLLNSKIFMVILTGVFLTDALDGITAKIFNAKSKLGKILDHTADKLLGFSLLFTSGMMIDPIMFIPLYLEMNIIKINYNFFRKFKKTMDVTMEGKCKNVVLSIAVGLVYLSTLLPEISKYIVYLIILTTPFQNIAANSYIKQYQNHSNDNDPVSKEIIIEEKKTLKEKYTLLKNELIELKEKPKNLKNELIELKNDILYALKNEEENISLCNQNIKILNQKKDS